MEDIQLYRPAKDFNILKDCTLPQSVDDNVFARFNEMMRRQGRDASILTAEQTTYLQSQIMEVLRFDPMWQTVIDQQDIGPGLLTYRYKTNQDITPPDTTQSFEGGTNVNVVGSETTVNLFGLHYDIHLDKVTLDGGNRSSGQMATYSPGVEQNQIREVTASLVDYWNHWVFEGSAYTGFKADCAVKGICNYSGTTTTTPTDATLTTAGDIQKLLSEMRANLILAKMQPPFEVHASPYVYNKAKLLYNATTRETDFDLINKDTDYVMQPGGGRMRMNPFLLTGTSETTTTGAVLMMKRLPSNINKVVMTYPMGFYPKNSTDLGWDAKLLVFGGVVLQRPTAVTFCSGLTTA